MPPDPTTAALVPIVATAVRFGPVQLATPYTRRRSAQGNVTRDWLLPLGPCTSHGYGKTPAPNSTAEKNRATLEGRLRNATRWGESQVELYEGGQDCRPPVEGGE